jgi:hypothetical protein
MSWVLEQQVFGLSDLSVEICTWNDLCAECLGAGEATGRFGGCHYILSKR